MLGHLRDLIYLLRTRPPAAVLRVAVTTQLARRFIHSFSPVREKLIARCRAGDFTHDWFSSKAPYWKAFFARKGLANEAIRVLEIGSFEGLSTCFLLEHLPAAHVTCVDTWAGSDEHRSVSFDEIERRFDENVRPWGQRITKFKGTSLDYFSRHRPVAAFDIVYIDGSHRSEDVLVDAIHGFAATKAGGAMIFDDYVWRYYDRINDNPAAAINAFLRLLAGRYRLEMVYHQLILTKLSGCSAVR